MSKTTPIRIRDDLLQEVREVAESTSPRIAQQAFVEAAIEDYLERIKHGGMKSVVREQSARYVTGADESPKHRRAAS